MTKRKPKPPPGGAATPLLEAREASREALVAEMIARKAAAALGAGAALHLRAAAYRD